ncbi:MAG: family ATPase [Panacagrimonas sp.]|jgi:SpoVK/Ycf46/Vps4 family AAA+-type ATPase|nr:AAA family ATPase [Panacagrimonas sp.]MCC2657656.1 family ATPase [Panacagrimonas sp.]
MMEAFEQRVILGWIANLGGRLDRFRWAQDGLLRFLTDEAEHLELDVSDDGRKLDADSWHAIVSDRLAQLESIEPSTLELNLRAVSDLLHLSDAEAAVMSALVRERVTPQAEDLFETLELDELRIGDSGVVSLLAAMLGATRGDVVDALSARGRLMSSGLFTTDYRSDCQPLASLTSFLQSQAQPVSDVRSALLGAPLVHSLDWEDYEHLRADRELAANLLGRAVSERAKGIHILLYGPPGTGKTEFCKTLSTKLGLKLYGVGQSDDRGQEPSRDQRIGSFRLCQKLLESQTDALLLFDEAEDLLRADGDGMLDGDRNGYGSRVYMHRLFEETRVPTLWTVNDPSALGPSVLRRMTYAIEMKVPPARVRERVWQRLLAREQVQVPAEEIRRLAEDFDAPPAVAAGAVRSARLTSGGFQDIRRAVHSIAKVMRGAELPPRQAHATRYEPALLNADLDLARLRDRLVGLDSRAFSMCLYGPPGTGKSAYVRWLAHELGVEVIQKRASDLLSKWVGENERNIAQAFAEARDSGAFLVFDEADSLLGDRRHAHQGWEISQVNEMLTWMESHEQPFACITNLMGHLDEAALRRFSFKVRFDFLKPEQRATAFAHYFELEAPAGVRELDMLTPGDFAVVRNRARLLGSDDDAAELLRMLRQEVAVKPNNRREIGFQAAVH